MSQSIQVSEDHSSRMQQKFDILPFSSNRIERTSVCVGVNVYIVMSGCILICTLAIKTRDPRRLEKQGRKISFTNKCMHSRKPTPANTHCHT